MKKIRHNREVEKKVKHIDDTIFEDNETLREDIQPGKARHEQAEPNAQKTDETIGEATQESGAASEKEVLELSALDKLAALNERYLRLLAEYDNFRKRTEREKEEIIKTASEKLIAEFLSILDNLDRATEHKNSKTTLEEYVKGVVLIEEQLRAVLSRAGLEPIDVVGKPFDPEIHDAVMQIETDEHEPGIVVQEAEKGYVLSGKVIRHPKVIVSN